MWLGLINKVLKDSFLKTKIFYFVLLFHLICSSVQAQSKVNVFLKPSDSLNIARKNSVFISEAVVLSATMVGLQSYWYSDYPQSKFHFINDNGDWMQMDKMGHIFTSYQLGNFGSEALKWSGVSKKNQLIFGSTLGFVFLSAVEVLDGHSSNWGASSGDIIANATGTALYVSQELLWQEQRITPKFSFHTTQYAALRPEVLGGSFSEQLLKDYNGQTYWFSANVHSFFEDSKIPKWLNVAFGYGADGMIYSRNNTNSSIFPKVTPFRQFYVSFDADLTKIKTNSHLLKTIFSVVNIIKIPAPTLEINGDGTVEFYAFYF